ncbi:hypothetical protein ACTXT7_005466 [Hymenolepis weldensis]
MLAKRLLGNLKHPEEQKCLWLFSGENNFHQNEKSIKEMSLRVNANADAYVETPQTIIKPCMDSVANGRPPMSSNEIQFHLIKLPKPTIGSPRIFMIMLHHTKFMAAFYLTRP